ncbi:hypothetical protein [Streptomyces phage Psst1]|nr:hypothetical protein [Streptomyces phage Psst1]WPJ30723.1 hypothetical protein [Streptomyces phage Psst2]
METWVQMALTSLVTLGASSGFWAYLQYRLQRKDRVKNATARLMMGVAYNTITTLGVAYIDRGYVTIDEYEELRLFYEPYKELGGNGLAERVMNGVAQLPFKQNRHPEIFHQNEGTINHVRVVTRQEQDAPAG